MRKLVAFYVVEHKQRTPHSAFRGQTPDEMYFGGGEAVPGELKNTRESARAKRFEENRALTCRTCDVTRGDTAAA